MGNSLLPMSDTDFWWLRYGLGIGASVPFALFGAYSVITRHSYVYQRGIGFVTVHDTQAVIIGVAYLGIALMFFANCYLQYHPKAGFYYQWPLGLGAILTIIGVGWCSWIFLAH